MFRAIYCPDADALSELVRWNQTLPETVAVMISDRELSLCSDDTILAISEIGRDIWVSMPVTDLDTESRLQAIVQSGATTLLLTGCTQPADMEKADIALTVAEIMTGLEPGKIRVVTSVADSAPAVLAIHRWNRPLPRFAGLVFNPQALADDLGLAKAYCENGTLVSVLATARDMACLCARTCGVPIYQDNRVAGSWLKSAPDSNLLSGELTGNLQRAVFVGQGLL